MALGAIRCELAFVPDCANQMSMKTPNVSPEVVSIGTQRADPRGLADMLREETQELHTRAERTGVVNDILRGQVSLARYVLYLRNLFPVYAQLETELERNREVPALHGIACRELYRASAIRSDLLRLGEPDSPHAVLPEATAYMERIVAAARIDTRRLIAHAYTRYLGDLSGGQILKRLLGRSPGLTADRLSFYDFPKIADSDAFKRDYRSAIDAVTQNTDAIVEEAKIAFELNIRLSQAVQEARAVQETAACEGPARL